MSPDFDIITSCCKRHVCSKHISSASMQALSSQHLPETNLSKSSACCAGAGVGTRGSCDCQASAVCGGAAAAVRRELKGCACQSEHVRSRLLGLKLCTQGVTMHWDVALSRVGGMPSFAADLASSCTAQAPACRLCGAAPACSASDGLPRPPPLQQPGAQGPAPAAWTLLLGALKTPLCRWSACTAPWCRPPSI